MSDLTLATRKGWYGYYAVDLNTEYDLQKEFDLNEDAHVFFDYLFTYDYIEFYYPEGIRTSSEYDLSSTQDPLSLYITWEETIPTRYNSIVIETNLSLDGGSTWKGWKQAANNSTIPDITEETNLGNAKLKTRQKLYTEDPLSTPILHSLKIEEYNLSYDDDLYWGYPVQNEGYWESPVLDLSKNQTVLNIYKMSSNIHTDGDVIVYTKYSEDGVNWSDYEEFNGEVVTCRYAQFKIELKTNNTDKNVYVDNFEFKFFVNDSSILSDNIFTLNYNYEGDSLSGEFGIEIERGAPTNARIVWDESTQSWKAGLENYEEDLILANNYANIPGTSREIFQISDGGAQIKENSGTIETRNSSDSDYADLIVNNLTVKGTTTVIDSENVQIGGSTIVLNSDYTGSSPTSNGGMEIERGDLSNAALIWDESNDVWKAGLSGSETEIVLQGNLPSHDFTQTEVDNLRAGKLDDGSTPWVSKLDLSGGTLTGDLDLGSNVIKNIKSLVLNDTGTADHSLTNGKLIFDQSNGLYIYNNNVGNWVRVYDENNIDIPATDFIQTEVDNLRAGKLDDGTMPWTSKLDLSGGTITGDLILEYSNPQVFIKETDATLPEGVFRIYGAGGYLRFDRNTAAAGDFSTYNTPLRISNTGETEVWEGSLNMNNNNINNANKINIGSFDIEYNSSTKSLDFNIIS